MTEKKRVLIIDNIAVESARRSVYRELAKVGEFDVELLLPESWMEQGDAVLCEEETDTSLRVRTTPFLFGYRQHRVVYTRLFSLLRGMQPHFLYIDSEPENYASLQCFLGVRFASPDTRVGLVSSRNLDYRTIGFPYKLAFTHRACDTVIRNKGVDVMFVRPMIALQLMEDYARKVYHLPHAVDCSLFRKQAVVRDPLLQDSIVIGYVGRLVESKGVQLVVQALPHLPGNIHLFFVGKGPLLPSLQRLAEDLGVLNRITFRPSVPYEEVPTVLNMMDILVLPSMVTKYWTEQFGRILIEAMACGVPIVASRSGEIPEVLGDAGLLFEMGDVRDLVEKLRLLAENPILGRELAVKGRARALRLYDASVVSRMIAGAIRESIP